LAAAFQPPLHESTDVLREFSEAVAGMHADRPHRSVGNSGLEVRTYLDLQGYDLDNVAEKRRREPGSTQLLYMFYSRIYEKLVGKQRGVDVPLFAPIDLSERLLGFRGILDLARDFRLCPLRVGRRELERIFATVHPGLDEADVQSPRRKFESKITYYEFLDLLSLCGDGGEPMDRSRLDGSRVRPVESRLESVKRLATYMSLSNVKKVKLFLHNAYRDVHFWKLSDGADFEKEARAAEMRSRPQWSVEPIPINRRLDRDGADAALCKYMERFTWLPTKTWEEFEVPILDMGTSFVGGPEKRFRITLTNRELMIGRFKLEVIRGCPLRLPWRDTMLGPGQSVEVYLECAPVECGEWFGAISVTGEWKAGREVTNIPTYARVLQPQAAPAKVAAQLPWHAPRPFRPGSAHRITLDPASIAPHQLRPPLPNRSSSSTRCSTRPTSAVSGYSALPPRLPSSSRPGSGLPYATRPSSSVGDRSSSATSGDWRQMDRGEGVRHMRPHSAPSTSPQKAPVRSPSPLSAAAGGGMAAVRARPRSASLRRHQTFAQ
jgi:hypothetical protein